MARKAVILRETATRDIDEAVDHYRREAGAEMAVAFVDAVEQVFGLIGAHPGIGSPLHAHELGIEGLRSRWVGRFPYLVFHRERGDSLDVWRVLQAQRDIPAWLAVEA